MASFLHNSSLWILGILFTLFSAFTSVQGIAAATMDGLSYRMAKFTAKNYIPILGGYISDGFDIVVASTSLIKNSFGAVLLIVVAVMVLKPLISIVSLNLGLQAVTALSEPVVADNCVEMFSGLRKCLTFLSALVVAVAFMFCILVIVAISCANGV
jgi:stage III sporulation protein AE